VPERKFNVVFLPIAEEDLTGIVLYISRRLQNPAAAMRVLNRIREAIEKRSTAPESFQKFESARKRSEPYYRINVGKSFSVFYVVQGRTIEVRRILYSARDIDSLLL
jgi:plasmid stabilization system protein ParE